MLNENQEDMILRQLQGRLTDEETALLRQWYDFSEENRKAYRDYCVLLMAQQTDKDRQIFTPDEAEAWLRTERRLLPRALTPRLRPWMRYAAVALIAVAAGFGTSRLATTIGQRTAETVIEVPAGAKTRVMLPDGTAVWLNAASRLSYSGAYGKSDRSITLNGEAYFDVTKNKRLPFEVKAGKTLVRVLGTRFDMKAYSTDERCRVTLLEGSLSVSTDGQGGQRTMIKPGEQAVITRGAASVSVHRVKAADYALWTTPTQEDPSAMNNATDDRLPQMTEPAQSIRKTLLFDEESLTQIANDLERAFNVDIEIQGNIGHGVYYGDFRNNETLFQILDAITSEGDILYEVTDNKITIRSAGGGKGK